MAAYALGFMDSQFASDWTAHLLFCDQREIETIRFTYGEAKALVGAVIEAFHDLNKAPNPCEYCAWCAKAETCAARRAIVAAALPAADPGFDFETVAADPDQLGRFLAACAVIGDFHERAARVATERIKAGGKVTGWKLVTRKGAEFVGCETVGRNIATMGFGPVLAAYGNLSATKFRDLWSQRMPAEKPFPDESVKHAAPSTYLKQSKAKAKP
jgi:hypothetical protein